MSSNEMPLRLLRAADVLRACPMAEAIDAVAEGFAALSAGQASAPTRLAVPLAEGGVALTMPASRTGAPFYSVKIVSVAPRNAAAGRPLVTATVLLADAASGEALALLDGTALTALRTGAAGGLAARLLARADASVAALFGAGAQARSQLLALATVRPIREVRVVARDPAHAHALGQWAAERAELRAVSVRASDPRAALADAAIAVTATTSRTPVFEGAALAPGAHVTAVGSFTPDARELDASTMQGARIVVDHRPAALAEAGELVGLGPSDVVEIGEIVLGQRPGRSDESERTVFKSVGNAIQDLAVAARAFERARAAGIGEEVAFP